MILPNIETLNHTDNAITFNRKDATDNHSKFNIKGLLPATVESLTTNRWIPTTVPLLILLSIAFAQNHIIIQLLLTMLITAATALLASIWSSSRTAYSQEIARLHKLAYQDELTGLSNRRSILQQLESAINSHSTGWVLMLDLDGFKQVNDNHGHEAGDEILKSAADRLSQILGENDKLARLGGDEFLVLADDSRELNKLIADIKKCLATPFISNNACICIGASVGAVRLHKDSGNIGELLRRADTAMYLDKTSRKKQQIESPATLLSACAR